MSDCGCSSLKAVGDRRGASISGFGRVKKTKKGRAKSRSGSKSIQNSGSWCVTWKSSGKKTCSFKSEKGARSFAKGRGTVSKKK